MIFHDFVALLSTMDGTTMRSLCDEALHDAEEQKLLSKFSSLLD